MWRISLNVICAILLVVSSAFTSPAMAASVLTVLAWDAPTTNVDGTPLTDLAGYKIYQRGEGETYGAAIATVPASVSSYSFTSDMIEGATYFWQLTAIDTSGNESGPSNEASKTVPAAPPVADTVPPGNPVLRLEVFIRNN